MTFAGKRFIIKNIMIACNNNLERESNRNLCAPTYNILLTSQRLEGIGPMGPGGVPVGGVVGPGGLYRPIPSPQHYRPPVPPYAGAASSDSGIFSTISNGLNSLYSNIFG